MFKFTYASTLVLTTALLAGAAFGQTFITAPPTGTTVKAGSNITVQVAVADSPINFDAVSVVIGLQSCPTGSCNPSSDYLGSVLYQGLFEAQGLGAGTNVYENFTVTIPESVPSGNAILSVANFYLDGLGYTPNLQVVNETLIIA